MNTGTGEGLRLRKVGLMSLLVMSLVLAVAGPAAAETATVGSGAGTGWEYAPDVFKECGAPTSGAAYQSDEFQLNHDSVYESTDTAAPGTLATYVGWARMTITTGPVTQAPQGAAGGICPNDDGLLVPSEVDIEKVVIEGTDPVVGTIYCDSVDPGGTYTRVNSTVVFEFVVECDIDSPTGSVQDVPVRHVVEGNQTACFPLACPQDPVNPDPHWGTDDAASSHMETAFEAEGPV